MSKKLPLVEGGNALPLGEYTQRFLPDLIDGNVYESTKLSEKLQICIEMSSSISSHDLDTCFKLLSETSQRDYAAAGMGWHPRRKIKEMKLPDLRYLLVKRDPEAVPEGFASFMLTYEDGFEVVYLYEIHLDEALRGTGLGRRLMSLVETAGLNAGMEKAMLTVFRSNITARNFYSTLGYMVDDYSPEPKVLRGGVIKEPDYDILSKLLN